MIKGFTRLELFSFVDGRLSTTSDDLYKIANHLVGDEVSTIGLVVTINILKERNPKWYADELAFLETLKTDLKTNDFKTLVEYIENNCNETILVPQLNDE